MAAAKKTIVLTTRTLALAQNRKHYKQSGLGGSCPGRVGVPAQDFHLALMYVIVYPRGYARGCSCMGLRRVYVGVVCAWVGAWRVGRVYVRCLSLGAATMRRFSVPNVGNKGGEA